MVRCAQRYNANSAFGCQLIIRSAETSRNNTLRRLAVDPIPLKMTELDYLLNNDSTKAVADEDNRTFSGLLVLTLVETIQSAIELKI